MSAIDRRAIIGAVPALAAVVATAPVAMAAAAIPSGPSRAAWEAALANYRQADAVYDVASERYCAADSAYFAARPTPPRQGLVLQAKGRAFSWEEAMANMKAEHEAYKRADAECRQRVGLDDAEAAEKQAMEASDAARKAVLSCPAPDLAAVLTKFELIQQWWCGTYLTTDELTPMVEDLRRLAEGE